MLVGFTRMDRLAGIFPVSGLTTSHGAVPGETVAVYAGVPVLVRTETVCGEGSCPPI